MKKLILISSLICNVSLAFELGKFETYTVKDKNTVLAIIDVSDYSLNWLDINADYLVKKRIPVMVKNASKEQVVTLNRKHKGLLSGNVPEPVVFLNAMMKQMGVKYYPVVIENGKVWQVNQ